MIQSFGDHPTEDVYQGTDNRAAREIPWTIWPVVRRKLDMVNAAQVLGDLRAPPGNRLEALKGSRSGTSSIRVNVQFRITFRFESGNAYDVKWEDHHEGATR